MSADVPLYSGTHTSCNRNMSFSLNPLIAQQLGHFRDLRLRIKALLSSKNVPHRQRSIIYEKYLIKLSFTMIQRKILKVETRILSLSL